MSRSTKWIIAFAAIALWGLLTGFVLFANEVTRAPSHEAKQADGIVVFTGEGVRIKEAARLLREGRARKLLISGVNPKIKEGQLASVTQLTHEHFTCCVTLGYNALNTRGNVSETQEWARSNGLKRLIVVTASYHMPRAMTELSLAMPETEFVAHSVLPTRFQKREWWLHVDDMRVLVSEYLKYLPSAFRFTLQQAANATE